ncbi:thiopeptide-type bacteriocin biosynthesis protein [Nonomuraea sp. NPDC050478]|uniref:thiopeptide-type bacteriocin biosynthesis protein n=1 Tax=Nonomuraea sp. NPDC050478 TaxID=3364365 RepID=UPI0037BCFC36
MDSRPWRQVNVTFTDWAKAERTAVAHLAPLLVKAEDERLITTWFFVRKIPCWRVRYIPSGERAQADVRGHLDGLVRQRRIAAATEVIYEPEPHAFGGTEAMTSAHDLFHLDSRHLLAYLARSPDAEHRRELSVLLCTALLRSAGLDWYEQGDVWARVADHRDLPELIQPDQQHALKAGLRRLMSVDAGPLLRDGSPLDFAAEWSGAFAATGQQLASLAADGLLHRGLRAVLAHHIIFAWNRLGMPYVTQAILAHTARQVVFGHDPAYTPEIEEARSEAR